MHANASNKYITVAYKLYAIEDGEKELVEEAPQEQPFQFISGLGTTLDSFENHLINLKKGDRFDFTIPFAEAYGEYIEEHVIDLPKHIFEVDGRFDAEMVKEGNVIPLMNAEGRRLNGTVIEVKEEMVIMDMNHPLAGADLNFIGEVIENREATNEEIQEIINIMSGEEGDGSGCGSCGSCGGGCNEDQGCGGCCH